MMTLKKSKQEMLKTQNALLQMQKDCTYAMKY